MIQLYIGKDFLSSQDYNRLQFSLDKNLMKPLHVELYALEKCSENP